MKSNDRAELPDLAQDLPTTRRDIEVLQALWSGKPGENLLPYLLRIQRTLHPAPPSRATSEGWLPFEL